MSVHQTSESKAKPHYESRTDALGKVRPKTGAKDLRNDEQIVKTLVDAITAGNSYTNAATLAGIGERTFFRWMAQGERSKRKTVAWQFWQRILQAQASAIHRNVLLVSTAARKDWRAAQWFLERRDPTFQPKEKIEHTSPPGQPVQVNMQVRSRFLSALERAYGSGRQKSQDAPQDTTNPGEGK